MDELKNYLEKRLIQLEAFEEGARLNFNEMGISESKRELINDQRAGIKGRIYELEVVLSVYKIYFK
jgi:hypothetical protein